MSDRPKISFRLSPALHAALAARVRQGGSLSDIIREALEAYLDLRPTHRPSDPSVSDTMSDMSARIAALAAQVADLQARLGQLEPYLEAQASGVRQHRTERPTLRPSSLPPPRTYDPEMALARMQELKAQGLSLAQIALTLNQEGIPTRHGRPWHKGTVVYLLQMHRD